jgi:SpoVK/Ycf46/Vps4 family AAA+-type ATPase
MTDFKAAFSAVGPSMQRGFQVQVDKMNWDDVGGLEDVKKVQNFLNIFTMIRSFTSSSF